LGVAGGAVLTLQNSVVMGNYAASGGGGLVAAEESIVTLLASTVRANTTDGDGGGFKGLSEYGPATRWNFVNSTFSGNAARGSGGGLFFGPGTCCVSGGLVLPALYSSTITDNTADSDQNAQGDGGGLAGLGAVLHNTLLAGNFDRSAATVPNTSQRPDCATTVATGSRFSLIQDVAGCTLAANLPGMVTGADPLLAALADNGGPTPTHLIGAAGAAFNAGDTTGCHDHLGNVLASDQRGFARHLASANVPGRCDIGSTELAARIGFP
jgi:hypothetical protein